MRKQYRQGDILLVQKTIPEDAFKDGSNIVLWGENEHRLVNGDVFFEKNGERYVRAEMGAELIHEEHGILPIPKGDYLVKIAMVTHDKHYIDGVGADRYDKIAGAATLHHYGYGESDVIESKPDKKLLETSKGKAVLVLDVNNQEPVGIPVAQNINSLGRAMSWIFELGSEIYNPYRET